MVVGWLVGGWWLVIERRTTLWLVGVIGRWLVGTGEMVWGGGNDVEVAVPGPVSHPVVLAGPHHGSPVIAGQNLGLVQPPALASVMHEMQSATSFAPVPCTYDEGAGREKKRKKRKKRKVRQHPSPWQRPGCGAGGNGCDSWTRPGSMMLIRIQGVCSRLRVRH